MCKSEGKYPYTPHHLWWRRMANYHFGRQPPRQPLEIYWPFCRELWIHWGLHWHYSSWFFVMLETCKKFFLQVLRGWKQRLFPAGAWCAAGSWFRNFCGRNLSNMAREVVGFQGSVFGCIFRPRFWGRPYWRTQQRFLFWARNPDPNSGPKAELWTRFLAGFLIFFCNLYDSNEAVPWMLGWLAAVPGQWKRRVQEQWHQADARRSSRYNRWTFARAWKRRCISAPELGPFSGCDLGVQTWRFFERYGKGAWYMSVWTGWDAPYAPRLRIPGPLAVNVAWECRDQNSVRG